MTGHVEELREDTDLADIDRLARQYMGQAVPAARPPLDQRVMSLWTAGTAGVR
jgi:hypothetical protein